MNEVALRSVRMGSALLVSSSDRPSGFAVRLAEALAPEPGRLQVVADTANGTWRPEFGPGLAEMLRGRGPVRLVMPGASGGRQRPYAQWLADGLGTEIVAPDGPLVPVRRMIYVGDGGTWAAFRPGQSPFALGPRFPQPRWERTLPPSRALSVSAESVPAGLWLRGGAAQPDPAVRAALFDMPVSFDRVTVAIGTPDATSSAVSDFATLRRTVPLLASPSVRLVPYRWAKTVPIGQELADRLSEHVVTSAGVPHGDNGAMFVYDGKGKRTWETFAFEVAYAPGALPEVTRWRAPLPGLAPADPRAPVFSVGTDVILEIVQSGLWLRGVAQRGTPEVRARPADPDWVTLTIGVPGETTPDTLVSAASTLAVRLDPGVRHYLRLTVEGPNQPSAQPRIHTVTTAQARAAALPEAVSAWDVTSTEPVSVPPGELAPEPEESQPFRRARTVAYPTVDPRHRSTPEEQNWLLEHLDTRYGRHSSAAIRMVASQPALRLLADAPKNAVVADLVAVSAYLGEGRDEIESALADGRVDVVVPYLNCVVSGLRRLPSYRGVAFAGAALDAGLTEGAVWTDAEIRQAVTTPTVALDGQVEFVIWSATGRRLDALDTDHAARRIAFLPGTRFQVVDPGTPGEARLVLLRELTSITSDSGDAAIRAKLLAAAQQRAAVPPDVRSSPPDDEAFSWRPAVADPTGAPGGPIPTTGERPRTTVRTPSTAHAEQASPWDAGSADFFPLLTREG